MACTQSRGPGWQWDLHHTIEALTSWHSTFSPPDNLLWAAAAAAGVHAASSLDTVLRLAGPVVNRLGKGISITSLVLGGIGVALAYYSAEDGLYPAVRDGGFKTACAILAFGGPVAVASYVSVGPPLWRGLKRIARFIKRTPRTIADKAASAKRWLQQKARWPWRRK